MKRFFLLLAPLLALPAATSVNAAPVHVALKSAASAAPNADGFLTLGTVAGITGGDKAARARFAAVLVARAPLSGETRKLTRGDLALKLRQAGINPDTQAVLEGADCADVTADPPAPNVEGVGQRPEGTASSAAASSAPGSSPASPVLGGGGSVIHSGEAVTILIQSGAMTITAPATARENGRVGDTIRVYRAGGMADVSVQVVDAQTVRMEI